MGPMSLVLSIAAGLLLLPTASSADRGHVELHHVFIELDLETTFYLETTDSSRRVFSPEALGPPEAVGFDSLNTPFFVDEHIMTFDQRAREETRVVAADCSRSRAVIQAVRFDAPKMRDPIVRVNLFS